MRGAHPKDRTLFSEKQLPALKQAAADLRHLLSRGYAGKSAISLVGDHFQLRSRQRQALFRSVFPRDAAELIMERCVQSETIKAADLLLDGLNIMITVETALAGGVLFSCDDGVLRDISETHGSYRKNENTEQAVELIRRALDMLSPRKACVWLDRPVSFSGRLAETMRAALGAAVPVEVVDSPDYMILSKCRETGRSEGTPPCIAATSDSVVLQKAARSFDLPAYIVDRWIPDAWVVAL